MSLVLLSFNQANSKFDLLIVIYCQLEMDFEKIGHPLVFFFGMIIFMFQLRLLGFRLFVHFVKGKLLVCSILPT